MSMSTLEQPKMSISTFEQPSSLTEAPIKTTDSTSSLRKCIRTLARYISVDEDEPWKTRNGSEIDSETLNKRMSTPTFEQDRNPTAAPTKSTELALSLRKCIRTLARYISVDEDNSWNERNSSEIDSESLNNNGLPFSELPQKKGFPLIGCMMDYYKKLDKTHLLLAERSHDLGPIFKEKVGSTEIVFLSDLAAAEKMVKLEGRYPYHFDVAPWLEYRKETNRACGILTAQGETWGRMRRTINKRLMRSKFVADCSPALNAVTDDFLNRLSRIRNSDNTISDLEQEIMRWALESTGMVLYGKRLGCLEDNPSSETEEFLKAAQNVVSLTQKLIYLPTSVAKMIIPSVWREHGQCWDTLFSVAEKCVDDKLRELEEALEKDAKIDGFLAYLLAHGSLTMEEIYANVTELMIGGIHSTTKVVQWMLYELSIHESSQQSLYNEVSQGAPSRAPISSAQVGNMPYLQAVLKETLRLYPVAGGIPRIIQNDMTLCDYIIPKGTYVMVLSHVIGRSADLFENPNAFLPERWLKNDLPENRRTVSFLPFGMGSRMCVGKRVAELEISVFLARLSQTFRLTPVTCEPVEIQSCLFLQPDKPLGLRFLERE